MNYAQEVKENNTIEYVLNHLAVTINENEIIIKDMLLDAMADELADVLGKDEAAESINHPAHPEIKCYYEKNMFTVAFTYEHKNTYLIHLAGILKGVYEHVAYELLYQLRQNDIEVDE